MPHQLSVLVRARIGYNVFVLSALEPTNWGVYIIEKTTQELKNFFIKKFVL